MTNFLLLYHYNINIEWLDSLAPWEKNIYLDLLARQVEEENLKAGLNNANRKAKGRKPIRPRRK